jgi:GrpB-like predicted nucleotidyltransferase (UPF0157 family)
VTGDARGPRARPPETNSVLPYDPSWPDRFAAIRDRLAPVLAGTRAAIEHVGSTAVSGLAAKPIIDIDVVVEHPADVPEAIERLTALGYVHRGDLGVAGREALDAPLDMPYHHLYVVAAGTKAHQDHVLFRDYLRRTPEAAARYAARKLEVAHLITEESRQEYLDAKAGVVEEILDLARRERLED